MSQFIFYLTFMKQPA